MAQKNLIRFASIGLLLIAGGVFYAYQASHSSPKISPETLKAGQSANTQSASAQQAVGAVEAVVVREATLEDNIQVIGTIQPAEETILQSEVSGRIISLNIPEGKPVKKGTLLVKLFDGDLLAQQRKLQAQIAIAEATEKRQKELLAVSGISRQEVDQTALQLASLRAELELVQVNITKTEIRAPFDGVIGLRKISVGAYITPAVQLATLRAVGALKIDFSVPERFAGAVREGSPIAFTVEGKSGKFSARVIATEESMNTETRNLTVRGLIAQPKGLLPGAFASVEVSLGERQKTIVIPTQAVIPQAREKKVIVNRNGAAQFITVKTGVRQAQSIEITEGIHSGDTVVTTGILFLRPGMPLKFSKIL